MRDRGGPQGAGQLADFSRGRRGGSGASGSYIRQAISASSATSGVAPPWGRARVEREGLARWGRRHPAGVSIEQPHPDLRFESRDRLGEGGLCQLESPGRAGHLTLLDYGHKLAELPEVELAPDERI